MNVIYKRVIGFTELQKALIFDEGRIMVPVLSKQTDGHGLSIK